MPKVREGHAEQKKQQILTAARRVCDSKPLYSVTMKDIVQESGMSQGGVYKYFANIDAVYVAILNEAALTHSVHADVETILGGNLCRRAKLTDLLQYLGRYAQSVVSNHGKLYFELMTLFAREPARFAAIKDQLEQMSVLEYLQKQLAQLILEGVAEKTFVPLVPVEDLFGFIHTSMQGLTQLLVSSHGVAEEHRLLPAPDAQKVMGVLALSVSMLLGYRAETGPSVWRPA